MIELLCLDVDGTMTDGGLYYSANGDISVESFKRFNVKDGLGLVYWHKIGKKSAIITKRANNNMLQKRASELGIDFVLTGIDDKGQCVRDLKMKLGLESSNVACIGDDMNDIPMFRESSISFAPNDAANGIKNLATIILSKNGGYGAVREMIEYILKKEQLYETFIQSW